MIESAISNNEFLISVEAETTADFEICDGAQTTDAKLIARILAGDEAAFEQMFERHKKTVAVIAARYFERAEQIEEVVQIAFTKAYFELENFRGAYNFSLSSWLGRIAANACLDILKKRSNKSESLACELSDAETNVFSAETSGSVEENLIESDLAKKLLRRLHPADRALLQMLYADELSVEQITQITGWSKSKIKVRAFRARRTLRKILHKFI